MNLKATITADDRASSKIQGVGNSFGKMAGAMTAGTLAANALQKALDLVVDVTKEAIGSAFNQVKQVENATIALRAYEKNGDAVNKVLKELIAYARSDMGVLFQREDLFAAAQTLKLYGQSTETLTDKVKILSKGVSLGKTTFQELSSIVGRAAAKGRLDAVDFDMLIERGIGLDKSFRGATVTSEQLFEALDKALPAELLEGRANTIDGAFIRLKSSLRDFGATILGVDKETTQFVDGGLGSRFIEAVRILTELIPQLTEKVMNFLGAVSQLASTIAQHLKPTLDGLKSTISGSLFPAIKGLLDTLSQYKPELIIVGKLVTGVLIVALVTLANTIRTVTFVVSILIRTFQGFVGMFRMGTNEIVGLMGGVARSIYQPFRWAFNNIVDAWNATVGSLNFTVPDWVPKMGGKGWTAPRLSRFANGTFAAAGGMALVGERGPEVVSLPAGSRVTPNNQASRHNGGGNVNVNVNVGLYAGSEMEKRRVAEELFAALKDVAGSKNMTLEKMMGI